MSESGFSDEEVKEFVIEAQELLDSAETELLAADQKNDFTKFYDAIFRVFHSLKGGAGMLNLVDLQNHMHSLENIFTTLKGKEDVEKSLISFFLSGVDAARQILNGKKITFDYSIASKPVSEKPKTPEAQKVKASEKAPPASSVSVAPATPAVKETKPTTPLVYTVDDEPLILESLVSILTSNDIRCETFDQPKTFLEAFKKTKSDVVLLDMSMPELSGLDVLKSIRQIDPDIPVIFLSGYLDKKILIEAIQYGIFGAIEKPFRAENVISYCQAAIQYRMLFKVLNRTINLLMYQFSDLDKFLRSQKKEDVANSLRKEMNELLDLRKMIRKVNQSSHSKPEK